MYISPHDRDDFEPKKSLELIQEEFNPATNLKHGSKFRRYIINTVGTPQKANWYLVDFITNLFWIAIYFSLNRDKDYPCQIPMIINYSNSIPLWYIQLTILTAILVIFIRLHEFYEINNKSEAGRTLYFSLFTYAIYELWLFAFWIYQIYIISNIYESYNGSVDCEDQTSVLVINLAWVTVMIIFRIIVPILYTFI